MVITRKIEVFVCEDDKELRKSYYEKLRSNRDNAVRVANMGISHLFALDNTMPYLSDEDKEKIEYLGTKGSKGSKQNAPYVVVSKNFKGQIDMGMASCVLQNVQKCYISDRKKGMFNKSLRSYKDNMPVPYKADRFLNLRFADYDNQEGRSRSGCFFTLMGVPFQMKFGRDRSGNRIIVERVINGEYKMCTSSLQFDRKRNKIFLLLCVDIPKTENKLDPKKVMYAFLGVMNPVVCSCDINAYREYDRKAKIFEIGTAEEFNYRRRQIQEAVKRCQMNNRYTIGGKGRSRKCKAIDRWHDKEKNYISTKLHLYSRMLVDLAIKHGCGEIHLLKQKEREDRAKDDKFVLRNWSFYGLKDKISYKCKLAGIKLTEDKE